MARLLGAVAGAFAAYILGQLGADIIAQMMGAALAGAVVGIATS